MTTLFVMCGVPGSTKSTWAHEFMKSRMNIAYVSRDEIRLATITDNEQYFSHEDEVYEKFINEIVMMISSAVDTIADATHLSIGARKKLINALTAKGLTPDKYQIIFVYMDVPVEDCIQRDQLRTGRAHVTESVIRRMYSQLTVPTINEFLNVKEVWKINVRNIPYQ